MSCFLLYVVCCVVFLHSLVIRVKTEGVAYQDEKQRMLQIIAHVSYQLAHSSFNSKNSLIGWCSQIQDTIVQSGVLVHFYVQASLVIFFSDYNERAK